MKLLALVILGIAVQVTAAAAPDFAVTLGIARLVLADIYQVGAWLNGGGR